MDWINNKNVKSQVRTSRNHNDHSRWFTKQQHLFSTENVNGRKQTWLFNMTKGHGDVAVPFDAVWPIQMSTFISAIWYFPYTKTWHNRKQSIEILSQIDRIGRICIPTRIGLPIEVSIQFINH